MLHTGDMNQKQKALKLLKKSGIARSSELTEKGVARVTVARLVAENKIEKIGHGLYCLPETAFTEKENLILISARYPKAVFCLLTALQIHELTTQLPRKVWIAMPKGSHAPQIDHPPIKMVQYSGSSYSEGIDIITTDKFKIRVYNPAKTIADCFKHRNKIGLDVAIEALKEAYQKNKFSIDEIWHYAKVCRVANIMRPYIEAMQ